MEEGEDAFYGYGLIPAKTPVYPKIGLWYVLNRMMTIRKLKWLAVWHEKRQDSWVKTCKTFTNDKELFEYGISMFTAHKESMNKAIKQLENI